MKKYVRVVLCVEEENLPELEDYLAILIEEDEPIMIDPETNESIMNPIIGAYVSEPFSTREEAVG